MTRRTHLNPRECATCGEPEFDETATTGCCLELAECADGRLRCDYCKDAYDQAHKCFQCGEIEPDVVEVDGAPICRECKKEADDA